MSTCLAVDPIAVEVLEHNSGYESSGDECWEDKHEANTEDVDVVEVSVHLAELCAGEVADLFIAL